MSDTFHALWIGGCLGLCGVVLYWTVDKAAQWLQGRRGRLTIGRLTLAEHKRKSWK